MLITADCHRIIPAVPLLMLLLLTGCSPAGEAGQEPEAEAGPPGATELKRFGFESRHMGTTFRILLYADDAERARTAADAAFARVAELDETLSDYDPESELSRLSATSSSGEAVPVSDDLFYMLQRSVDFSHASDGAFDITVGPVVRLWRRARRQQQRPDDTRLAEAREAVGYRHIELDEADQTARLTAPNMRLDLGGIAKGWATAEALDVLREQGVDRALVDGGGDIALGQAPPANADRAADPPGWRIAIAQPLAGDEADADDPHHEPLYLVAENLAVATSGDVFQAAEIEGVRYSHIIDPRTGEPTTTPMAITVIADDATTVDALASAIAVMGPEAGIAFAETLDAAAIVTYRDDDTGRLQRRYSDNLDAYPVVAASELERGSD